MCGEGSEHERGHLSFAKLVVCETVKVQEAKEVMVEPVSPRSGSPFRRRSFAYTRPVHAASDFFPIGSIYTVGSFKMITFLS